MSMPTGIYNRLPRRMPLSLGFKRYALYFNGSSHVQTLYAGSPSELTVMAFVKPQAWPDSPQGYLMIVGKRGPGYTPDYGGLYVERSLGNFLFLMKGADGESYNLFFGKPVEGRWFCLAGVLKAGKMYAYENGVLKGTLDFPADVVASDVKWSVGGNEDGSLNLLKGTVALAMVYERALSGDEVRYNMLNYHNPVRNGLVLWLADRIVGGTWHDESGQGNHGTIYGAQVVKVKQYELRAEVGL